MEHIDIARDHCADGGYANGTRPTNASYHNIDPYDNYEYTNYFKPYHFIPPPDKPNGYGLLIGIVLGAGVGFILGGGVPAMFGACIGGLFGLYFPNE